MIVIKGISSQTRIITLMFLAGCVISQGVPRKKAPPDCTKSSAEQACEAPLKEMPAEPRLPPATRTKSDQGKATEKAKAAAKKGAPARTTTQVTK